MSEMVPHSGYFLIFLQSLSSLIKLSIFALFRCFIPSISGYVSVSLAGIVCPRVNVGKADAETPSSPEPFALQARHFSELRLLNRELDISVHGAAAGSGKAGGSEGSLLVTVSHRKV